MLKNKSKIDKILSEDFVKNSVIKWLSANGWGYFQFGGLRDKGVDIKAKHQKYSRYFLVEAKGEGKIGTTGKGIGPTYTDKISRNGLRVGEIVVSPLLTKIRALK